MKKIMAMVAITLFAAMLFGCVPERPVIDSILSTKAAGTMTASTTAPPTPVFTEPFTPSPSTNADPTPAPSVADGIVYRNYQLGVSLTFPVEWKDHFLIREHEHGFDVCFWGNSDIGRTIEMYEPSGGMSFKNWQEGMEEDNLIGAYGVQPHGIYLFSLLTYEQQHGDGIRYLGTAYGVPIYIAGPGDATIFALLHDDDPLAAEDFELAMRMDGDIWGKVASSFAVLEPADHTFRNERLGYELSIPASWTGRYRVRESFAGNYFDYWSEEENETTRYRPNEYSLPIGLDFFYVIADYPAEPLERDMLDSIREIGSVGSNAFYYCTATDSSLSALMPAEGESPSDEYIRMKAMADEALEVAMTFRSLVP